MPTAPHHRWNGARFVKPVRLNSDIWRSKLSKSSIEFHVEFLYWREISIEPYFGSTDFDMLIRRDQIFNSGTNPILNSAAYLNYHTFRRRFWYWDFFQYEVCPRYLQCSSSHVCALVSSLKEMISIGLHILGTPLCAGCYSRKRIMYYRNCTIC